MDQRVTFRIKLFFFFSCISHRAGMGVMPNTTPDFSCKITTKNAVYAWKAEIITKNTVLLIFLTKQLAVPGHLHKRAPPLIPS